MKRLIISLVLFSLSLRAAFGIEVTNVNDSGSGSLRKAIVDVAAGGTITFAQGLSGTTILLSTGELTIGKALTIDATALSNGVTIDAGQTSRVMEITASAIAPGVTLKGLTLSNGKTEDGIDDPDGQGSDGGDGGGILNSGALTIQNCVLTNHQTGRGGIGGDDSVGGGGSGGNGGAIFSTGSLVISNSLLSNNRTGDGGEGVGEGGIGDDGGDGGAIYSSGMLMIDQSTVSGNRCGKGGDGTLFGSDGGNGGGVHNRGTMTATATTFSNNTTGAEGRGDPGGEFDNDGQAGGGGAILNSTNLTVVRSTFTGNAAVGSEDSGGRGGAISNFGPIELQHCTIVRNSAPARGAGIFNFYGGSPILFNCIVAENRTLTNEGNLFTFSGAYSLTGVNIVSDLEDSGVEEGSEVLVTSPRLAPLGDYGGPVQTMPPGPGSAAIDNAGETLSSGQRGFPQVGLPDIGAVEFQGTADLVRLYPVDFDQDGLSYGVEQALGSDPFVADGNSSAHPTICVSMGGIATFTLGKNENAIDGTQWIVSRSLGLNGTAFIEIYRFTGAIDIASPGILFERDLQSIAITDTTLTEGVSAFYRFETELQGQ